MTLTILTTREVAEKTGWTVQTINRWTKAGHLPFLRKVGDGARGGFYLYDAAVIDQVQPKDQAYTPPWAAGQAS